MQIVAPVVEKLRATKCAGNISYVPKNNAELLVPVHGIIDGILDQVFSFYSLSYQVCSPPVLLAMS